ncbi:ROK family protein [Rhodoluna lacicola]|uniref:Transcriptional regulator/sugar kinase n=1 Tax=Rhodoluna lacicola TaxID=529884 RepID=A0A060JEU0_9MICO|nr:ROK family protein [Rhodoluna lacicola]AIC47082.1 Transcriptional regulator/sugar kinase [Rhodoluna lacicola]
MLNLDNQASKTLGQNRDDVRQHNLSALLKMIHQSQTVSRAQLTTSSGLNRSTISDLVSELEGLGLVYETEASANGVGRPSLQVSASDQVVAFSVNTDVDAVTVATVTFSGAVIAKKRFVTTNLTKPEKAVSIAAELIADFRKDLKPGTRIVGIGVAIPGQVRVADGVIRLAPHLGWVEFPFGPMLRQITGLPVYVDNDASLGCVAERIYGNAKGFSDVVYLFAGSGGIGGGVVVDGIQLRGAAGYAGELGHVRISTSNAKDYSGLEGTLEALVRRDDLLEVFKLYAATDDELLLEMSRTKAAKAKKLIETQIDGLAAALGNFVNIFNPEVIVLDGFLGGLFEFDSERLISGIKANSLAAANERVVLRTGGLGSDLLMIGAALLPFSELTASPSGTQLYPAKAKAAKP